MSNIPENPYTDRVYFFVPFIIFIIKTIKIMKKLLLLLSLTSVILFSCQNESPAPVGKDYTDVIIKNSSSLDSVQVYVTLQAQESIVGKFGMDSSNFNPNSKNPDGTPVQCKGMFWAKKDSLYHLGNTTTLYGAVVSFGADNYGCEAAISHGWQYGINIFEFTVNTPSTGNESTDLSCLDGLNSFLMLTVSDTSNWIAGGNVFKSIQYQKKDLHFGAGRVNRNILAFCRCTLDLLVGVFNDDQKIGRAHV